MPERKRARGPQEDAHPLDRGAQIPWTGSWRDAGDEGKGARTAIGLQGETDAWRNWAKAELAKTFTPPP